MTESATAQRIKVLLEPALGRHTAQRALLMVCEKTGRSAEALGEADLEAAASVLLPILRTLLGQTKAEQLLARLSAG